MPLNVAQHHGQRVLPIERNKYLLQSPHASPVPHQYIQSRYDNVPSNIDDNNETYSY